MMTPIAARVEDDFGIGEALGQAWKDLRACADVLADYAASGVRSMDGPFINDSRELCIRMYTAALSRVRRRFWTTSFLSSGFWSRVDATILAANLELMGRLRQGGVGTRRLFLLPLPAEAEVERWQDERLLLRKSGDQEALQRFDAKLASLRENVEGLLAHGCDVRIVHDADKRHRSLPPALAFDHSDSELGIYDDWRVDVFRGGRSGIIESLDSFTPVMRAFEALRDDVLAYFETLWAEARPISAFLERLRKAIEDASTRIDYQLTWLARYDHGLPQEDQVLKLVELSTVKAEIQRLGKWGTVRRHLDIGTCTGRYPLSLRHAVAPQGEILGIDNDMDCVRYARRNTELEAGDDARLRIERVDFCTDGHKVTGPFDLITCMLGTLIHFGREADGPPWDDTLQRALEKLAGLLDEDGVLFLSVWSQQACRELDLLHIYTEEDKEHLARATPPAAELQDRLTRAGLRFGPPYQLEGRMDLYRCSLPGSPGGRAFAGRTARRPPDPSLSHRQVDRRNHA
jgi:SAM-dependent methyltransferase